MAVFFYLKIAFHFVHLKKIKKIMSKDKKGVHTGLIEKDADGNYFCGEYLLDFQYTEKSFKITMNIRHHR